MKKSRIFMATGGLILAISAVFATKAHKRFAASFATGKLSGTSNYFVAGSNIFTTRSGGNNVPVYVAMYTNSSNSITGTKITDVLVTKTTNTQLFYVK
jgi:hypothetical protein